MPGLAKTKRSRSSDGQSHRPAHGHRMARRTRPCPDSAGGCMTTDRLPQTLAERTELPARVRTLLEEQLAECGARLEPTLRASLTELEQQLFKQAEQARNNAEQQTAFESLREVKRNRADAAPLLLQTLERRLAALGLRSQAPRARFDLTLVDHDE